MPVSVIIESVPAPERYYLAADKPSGRSEISSNTGDEGIWTVRSIERSRSAAGSRCIVDHKIPVSRPLDLDVRLRPWKVH